MKTISVERLQSFCIEVLEAAGLSEPDARTTAEVLVITDTWGTFTHGTNHLPNYVKKIHAGGLDPKARPEIVFDGAVSAVLDGHNAIGIVTSCMAMAIAIEKAKSFGVAYVGVRDSNHFGAAGYYANMAVREGMIGIAMSNTDANMVAPGGRGPVVGNNPFSYAVPAGKEWPIFLDIALSATAASRIVMAKAQGKKIPENWLVDREGRPTTDIGDWPAFGSGSLMPMAGHKGYGLSLMVEVLAAVLSGGAITNEVGDWLGMISEAPRTGHAFLAIDVGKIIPIEIFKERMDKMIRDIRDSPKASGSDRIYLPGEMEWEKRSIALKNGIPLPEPIIEKLSVLAQSMGTDFQGLLE